MILFETPRLLVRQYDLSDEDSFFLLNGNEEVVRYIRPAKTRVESDLYLRQVIEAYQANRMKIRFKDAGGKPQLVHTLNGSSLALPRIMACLLENNQTPDGIELPGVLHSYFGNQKL